MAISKDKIQAWVNKLTEDELRTLAVGLIEVLDDDEQFLLSSDEEDAEICWAGSGDPLVGESR
jgi:hypothetical protein